MSDPATPEGAPRPIVCIHGYSAQGTAFAKWREKLAPAFSPPRVVHIGEYVSLTNEVSIKDIAEGFDRALRIQGLSETQEFDAIVHSTGMLVIRSWLAAKPTRCSRLRHLIGLAPATYGSPLAHKGRSWLGSVFKGNKTMGPDFLEAGDEILDALELGSRFTWDLAHRDLFGQQPFYGKGQKTPYVFIFCGNRGYDGLRKLVTEDGTDGTVRWAGCSLNSRKIVLDLTRDPDETRVELGEWHNVSNVPLLFWEGLNHGTIMDEPPEDLILAVSEALRVDDDEEHQGWCNKWQPKSDAVRPDVNWQQFILRVIDERDDPVPDYSVTLHGNEREDGSGRILHRFEDDVHSYGRDKSFKNFHLNLNKLTGNGDSSRAIDTLEMEIEASTGTSFVGYRGISDRGLEPAKGNAEIHVDMTPLLRMREQNGKEFRLFYPFTTTLVEIRIDREPLPTGEENRVYKFLRM
jgi:pimeloyl-ACP methyl ester carboxylesterase